MVGGTFPPTRAPRRRLCVSLDDDPRHSGADTGSGRADGATERRSRRWRSDHCCAVATTGSLLGVSTATAVPFAEIARTGAPWWFQVYVTRDHTLTERLVERAVANGARALLLTVDMMAPLPASVNPRDWPESPAKTWLANLTADEQAAAGPAGVAFDPSINFDTIGWLRQLSGLPVVAKGVLRADDARRCVDAGAAGVVVSTHGGRRLGPTISSAQACLRSSQR
jgi:4-hydroxymandelate oxidase